MPHNNAEAAETARQPITHIPGQIGIDLPSAERPGPSGPTSTSALFAHVPRHLHAGLKALAAANKTTLKVELARALESHLSLHEHTKRH